eukprot:6350-Heterococcus_DN1.PRE.1
MLHAIAVALRSAALPRCAQKRAGRLSQRSAAVTTALLLLWWSSCCAHARLSLQPAAAPLTQRTAAHKLGVVQCSSQSLSSPPLPLAAAALVQLQASAQQSAVA